MTAPRKYRATAIEWLSHVAFIEATSAEEARAKAEKLWAEKETDAFWFEDQDLEQIIVEEMPS